MCIVWATFIQVAVQICTFESQSSKRNQYDIMLNLLKLVCYLIEHVVTSNESQCQRLSNANSFGL